MLPSRFGTEDCAQDDRFCRTSQHTKSFRPPRRWGNTRQRHPIGMPLSVSQKPEIKIRPSAGQTRCADCRHRGCHRRPIRPGSLLRRRRRRRRFVMELILVARFPVHQSRAAPQSAASFPTAAGSNFEASPEPYCGHHLLVDATSRCAGTRAPNHARHTCHLHYYSRDWRRLRPPAG